MSGACKAQNGGFRGRRGKVLFYRWCGVFACLCADAERSATRETSPRSPSSSSLSTRLCRWSCAPSTQLSITLRLTCSKKSSWWTTTAMTVSRNWRFSFLLLIWNLCILYSTVFACRGWWEKNTKRVIISFNFVPSNTQKSDIRPREINYIERRQYSEHANIFITSAREVMFSVLFVLIIFWRICWGNI